MPATLIFDTDIIIWAQKGNLKAATLIDKTEERAISIMTFMELLQGAKNKIHHRKIKEFLHDYNFLVLPLTANIGHRALIYVEEYTLVMGIGVVDAIIAATAVEASMTLATSNQKHYNKIRDLQLKVFNP